MTTWWGRYEVKHGTTGRWRVGPMTLWIQRLRGEWRVAWESAGAAAGGVAVDVPCADEVDLLALPSVARFGVSGEGETIDLQPRLADRPVVTHPERPFYVPAREKVTVYVSTPLWLAVTDGDSKRTIEELPIERPSDTWFGPDTMHGVLCYATTTACRLQLEDVRVRPHRAITEVVIDNATAKELLLERMQLPVDYLGLFLARDGALWTPDIEFHHEEGQELQPLEVKRSSAQAGEGRPLVTPPRRRAAGNVLVRAFSSLFE